VSFILHFPLLLHLSPFNNRRIPLYHIPKHLSSHHPDYSLSTLHPFLSFYTFLYDAPRLAPLDFFFLPVVLVIFGCGSFISCFALWFISFSPLFSPTPFSLPFFKSPPSCPSTFRVIVALSSLRYLFSAVHISAVHISKHPTTLALTDTGPKALGL
jgi:hypothetical protein